MVQPYVRVQPLNANGKIGGFPELILKPITNKTIYMEISLISDSGIQFYTLPQEVTIDVAANLIRPQRFFEYEFHRTTYLDSVLFVNNEYVKRSSLLSAHYLNAETNELTVPEQELNMQLLGPVAQEKVMTVNNINQPLGPKREAALSLIENRWIPLPYFHEGEPGHSMAPTDWCRVMFSPVRNRKASDDEEEDDFEEENRTYRVTLAFDTTTGVAPDYLSGQGDPDVSPAPYFEGQNSRHYALCGVSRSQMDHQNLSKSKLVHIESSQIPMSVLSFCSEKYNPWLNPALQEIFKSTDLAMLPPGQKLKYIAYYIYFVSTIHKMGFLPDVKLYNAESYPAIKTTLVLDIGNSRTFGLLAEDPLDPSFSNTAILALRDLGTGRLYKDPFDMRLCFKEERFGVEMSERFQWPSVVRLGHEALDAIYGGGNRSLLDSRQYDTSHSSPKRYLWDSEPFQGEWKFISEKDRVNGPAHSVFFHGLMEQFRSDGSFTPDPRMMGSRCEFSRASLMTFAFVEILLQARSQANSYSFRLHAGKENQPRHITRIIQTCPTAMTRHEQIVLRRSMEEASIALKRYYAGTFMDVYDPSTDGEKVEIIPSVADLKLDIDNIDRRRSWNYDEATCCQMVYVYSELRRFLGNTAEFFATYGRRRNAEEKPSLTVASIDIGAGTSDLMICNYRDEGMSLEARPLFFESFHSAGDDLVKRIITDVLLEGPRQSYPGASGIITARLIADHCPDVAEKMHHFFGDTANMGVVERRMRKEFNIQVLIPIAYRLLDMLQRGEAQRELTFADLFPENRPSTQLMDFFADQMGFRFEELSVTYSPDYLNEIVRRVFEMPLRKWAGIFSAFKADIVLLSGRPCSLPQVRSLMRRLMPVAPNRLISMADYRVGAWYPGSTDVGRFSDKKSLVAVGALIAYLASDGKLPMFKLNTTLLKKKILPTSEYVGVMNTRTGAVETLLTPRRNIADIKVSGFPVCFGTKQLDIDGYPTRMIYCLDFNHKVLRAEAGRAIIRNRGLDPDTPVETLPRDMVSDFMETLRLRTCTHLPLTFSLERDYTTDKESVKITGIIDQEGNSINPQLFDLRLQSRAEHEAGWLDTGVFILHINTPQNSI